MILYDILFPVEFNLANLELFINVILKSDPVFQSPFNPFHIGICNLHIFSVCFFINGSASKSKRKCSTELVLGQTLWDSTWNAQFASK